MNFVEKNDSILQKWKEHIEKVEKDPKFASDGIMFRGEIDQYSADQNERWSNPEKENELWENAPVRYLFFRIRTAFIFVCEILIYFTSKHDSI